MSFKINLHGIEYEVSDYITTSFIPDTVKASGPTAVISHLKSGSVNQLAEVLLEEAVVNVETEYDIVRAGTVVATRIKVLKKT